MKRGKELRYFEKEEILKKKAFIGTEEVKNTPQFLARGDERA